MVIDWINGLIGGLMIGAAAGVLLLANGKIAGVSGILGGLVDRRAPADWVERTLFVLGLLASPLIFFGLGGARELVITESLPLLIAGGLAVGVGTRFGGGCTSGHGVCGAARLSKRSIVAMAIFMATAIGTVAVMAAN